MNRQSVRERLTGPIPSIGPPFHRDGALDFHGLRNLVEFDIAAGAKTILLTAGDSHYLCLSDEEIAEVTRVTCEQTAGRAMVVAADRHHSTGRAIEFAKFAREAGADVLMCMPPNWGRSCTAETLAEHYAAVARHMPVMIVTNVFGPHGTEFGLRAIDLALDRSESVVAVKDDMRGEFARRLCLLAHERCAIFAGGQKQGHMNMWPYGCDGYLSTFLGLKPEVAHDYWAAIEAANIPGACRIIAETDMPYFDFVLKLPGNFDAGMHGAYELYGLAKRWRRPPYYSLNDSDMEALAGFFRERGLL